MPSSQLTKPTSKDVAEKVRLAALSEESKSRVWAYLQANNADLAAKLQQAADNAVVRALLEQHDASLAISADQLPDHLKNSLTYLQ